MPIVSRKLKTREYTDHYIARYTYVWDDGYELVDNFNHVMTVEEAELKLDAQVPELEEMYLEKLAREKVSRYVDITDLRHAKQAIKWMVKAKMLDGFPVFLTIKNHMQAKGWNLAKLRTELGITDDQWVKLQPIVSFFNTNSATLIAFEAIKGDFPGQL